MKTVDWTAVSNACKTDCPSSFSREKAERVLERVELIGPLSRPPEAEFKRVYKSLHWNEPDRVMDIINAVEPRTKGADPKVVIQLDAWGYIVGVLDEWVTQARVFYLVSGILEASLRARLNARMTEVLGPKWPASPDVPSQLHELSNRAARDAQLQAIHGILERSDSGDGQTRDNLLSELNEILKPPAADLPAGSIFVRNMSFGVLKMFFEKKSLWAAKVQLQNLFRGPGGNGGPPNQDKVKSILKRLNEARNEVAHYRPEKFLTFEQALFDAATLASWFGEDIQHIYSAIDTRETPELSVLLRAISAEARWEDKTDQSKCYDPTCGTFPPLDWLLPVAPLTRDEMVNLTALRACLFHRVISRRRTK
jgi:hypothetical protein